MWCRVDITKQHFVIVNGWTSSRCRARSTLQGNVSPDLCFARKSLMAADILNLTKFYGIRFTTKTQIKFITRTLLEKLKLQTFAQSWLYNTTCKSISRAEQRGEKLGLWRLEVWRGGGIYIQFILHISCIYLYIYICTDVSTLSIVFSSWSTDLDGVIPNVVFTLQVHFSCSYLPLIADLPLDQSEYTADTLSSNQNRVNHRK